MRPLRYAPQFRQGHETGHFIFSIVALVFWVAVIIGIVLLISHYSKTHGSYHGASQDPLDIAKARYARGEITKEEFIALKKDLT